MIEKDFITFLREIQKLSEPITNKYLVKLKSELQNYGDFDMPLSILFEVVYVYIHISHQQYGIDEEQYMEYIYWTEKYFNVYAKRMGDDLFSNKEQIELLESVIWVYHMAYKREQEAFLCKQILESDAVDDAYKDWALDHLLLGMESSCITKYEKNKYTEMRKIIPVGSKNTL